ncbi:YeeE/YedE family protein [Winogradskyella ouciana]|uniref:YeeE/YedE family protein n=1 Tax=Winogradskyella ouciana TaxID=2608631 RepID=A0A7K1GEZ4_9FLAO|nr:YeeE/YedE family protein [Winogradskyella ouciana]MTE26459.1 YeeE/YedE family protein [Winogradskyella ouciana]
MKNIVYIIIGILFGIIMYKSEAASWFRIYEMFQFGSFHMYGLMGSAVLLGILGVQVIKKNNLKPLDDSDMSLEPKDKSVTRYLVGGIIFGLGWALAGVCPGPMYVLAGAGYVSVLIVILGALLGTLIYGVLRKKLPH